MAGDDVDHARRETGLFDQAAEIEHRRRGVLGRLQHNRVTRRQRRPDLHCDEEELRVPRHDRGHDAERFALGEDEQVRLVDGQSLAADLVGAAGVEVEELGDVFRLPARLLQHLAGIDGLCPAEILRLLRQQVGEIAQAAAAFGRGHRGPRSRREGAMGGAHRPVDIVGGGFRNLRPDFPRRRVHAVEQGAVRRANPVAIDQHLVTADLRHRWARLASDSSCASPRYIRSPYPRP